MNPGRKFRSILDMSRKQSKFVPEDCWSEIGRYRRHETPPPQPYADNGSYIQQYVPSFQPFAWNLGLNSRSHIFNPSHSTAMKRANNMFTVSNPKSPKMENQQNPTCPKFPGTSSSFRGYGNTETYFPPNNTLASNSFQDIPRPQHFHHFTRHFSNETNDTSMPTIDTENDSSSRMSTHRHQSHADEMTKSFELHRDWDIINSSNTATAVLQSIRVVSYNILSQKLLELNRYLYRKCDPDILKWNYRWEKLQKEIQELSADILCLQEVEECHYECVISKFLDRNNYELHYKRRTGNNTNKPDGVLIAYKKDKFQLVESRKVEYRRGNVEPVNQDNVALITVLKPNGGAAMPEDSRLCIVNTHLLYNPKRGDIKLAQLSTLFAEVHDVLSSYNTSKVPILMCGDFNSVPRSWLYNFITNQELSYKGMLCKYVSGQWVGSKGQNVMLPKYLLPKFLSISCQGCVKVEEDHEWTAPGYCLNHSLGKLLSSYCHDNRQATTTQDKGVTVDYIFHTPYNECELSLQPNRRLSLVSPHSLAAARGIPNAVHPSDHLPIVVDFDLVLSGQPGEGESDHCEQS